MSLYTIGVWHYDSDGKWVRSVEHPEWRMPFHWADSKAAELTDRYPDRVYAAVNVNELDTEPDSLNRDRLGVAATTSTKGDQRGNQES